MKPRSQYFCTKALSKIILLAYWVSVFIFLPWCHSCFLFTARSVFCSSFLCSRWNVFRHKVRNDGFHKSPSHGMSPSRRGDKNEDALFQSSIASRSMHLVALMLSIRRKQNVLNRILLQAVDSKIFLCRSPSWCQ